MTPLRSCVSDSELERRWSAVRTVMAASGLDAIVMQNSSDWVGGYVRWFTDMPATNGYARTVIFHADRPMSVVEMGPRSRVRNLGGADPIARGIDRVMNTPSFSSADFTNNYQADLVTMELKRTGARRIGLLSPGSMQHSLVDSILSIGMEASNASDSVDESKAYKSPEEQALIRQVAQMQDGVFERVCQETRPGMTEVDVSSIAHSEALRLGSDQGIVLCGSARIGNPTRLKSRQTQNRLLTKGDYFPLLIEVNGAGGMYVELGRTIVLGRAPASMHDALDSILDAQKHTLGLLTPGAKASDIAQAHDAWMSTKGLPIEKRLYAHGQGVDMVERPLIRGDETMLIGSGMHVAVHPAYEDSACMNWICDNFIIGEKGPGGRLHSTEQRLFEVE
jgi:Xaa-Pro aminopeptidase